MKSAFAILMALVLVSQAVELYENEFMQWRLMNNKFYSNELEHAYRMEIFSSNMEYAAQHNAGESSFKLGASKWADMTNEEYKQMLMPKGQAAIVAESTKTFQGVAGSVPESKDWRDDGAVTPVKDQGQCGSCWSFSTTGGIEGAWKLAGNDLVSLSEQNLMDCSWLYGNLGCDGGLPSRALSWVKHNGGIDTEASYPYEEKSSYTCKYDESNKGAEVSGHVSIESGSEDALKQAAGTVGPISVAIDASNMSFQLYVSGVYTEANCKNGADDLDHAVLVVGYGSENGEDYWLVKNSWNTVWGEEGYIKMARNNDNMCGVATSAVYPEI